MFHELMHEFGCTKVPDDCSTTALERVILYRRVDADLFWLMSTGVTRTDRRGRLADPGSILAT